MKTQMIEEWFHLMQDKISRLENQTAELKAMVTDLCWLVAQLANNDAENLVRIDDLKRAVDKVIVDGKVTQAAIASSERKIISAFRDSTRDPEEGCHHEDPEKDRIVQSVILYLSQQRPGYAINKACCKVVGRNPDGRCKLDWLRRWCYRNQTALLDAADSLR